MSLPTRRNSEILDRLPPQNLDAERAVIGSLILDPRLCDDVAQELRADDFYGDANRRIFEHILALHDAGGRVDIAILAARLRSKGDFEAVGGAGYLAEVAQSVPVAAHALYYAAIVREKALRRELIHASTEILRGAWDETIEPASTIVMAETKLQAIHGQNASGDPRPIADVIPEAIEEIDATAKRRTGAGVMTGLHTFDQLTGGLFPGELTILAARPGVGKTSLALQIAGHVATRRTAYVATLEMSDRELVKRMMCSVGGVSGTRIRTGRLDAADFKKLATSGAELSNARLYLHDNAGLTVNDIRRACRKLAKHGLALAVVDYLGLVAIPDTGKKRYEAVGDSCKAFKAIARELGIAVLVLCQLNRQAETTAKTQRPRLHHLRESGDIEQTADMVLLLHREDPKTVGEKVTATLLDTAKNRNGETGDLWLEWEAHRTRYACARPSNFEDAFDAGESF
jgi:replicative DNA helicase